MREQFEKLPRIAGILVETGVYYSYTNERYTSCYEKGHESYLCGFVNGAWYAYQEQQKKIDGALKELELLNYYRTRNSDNAIKILKGADK